MGAAVDRWLAKAATIKYLRRLMTPDKTPASYVTCHNGATRSIWGYAAAGSKQEQPADTDVKSAGAQSYRTVWKDTVTAQKTAVESAELGLQMSLNAGVSLLGEHRDADAFSELGRQADVNSDNRFGLLLVDNVEHREYFKLWIELLRFRQRTEGLQGVADVWHGMRRRNIDLPVTGPEADILWTTFAHSAISTSRQQPSEGHNLLSDLFNYAQELKARTGRQYDGLYKCIVGRWFRVRPRQATPWHSRLCSSGLAEESAIGCVAGDAMLSTQSGVAFTNFRRIYQRLERKDLYDACIREAIELKDEYTALRWHQMFLGSGDGPSQDMFVTPAVQRLFELDKDASLPMVHYDKDRHVRTSPQDKKAFEAQYPPLTRASMNTIVGDVHGIKPKEISDSFCAKMFATRAFSLGVVIKGLSFFGVETLGPLATREMAVRAGTPLEFSNTLSTLKENGLTLDCSVFAQLTARLGDGNHALLWATLVQSDQHPEGYEDAATQEALLASFLAQEQWRQAHIALLALALIGSHASLRAWNLVLQHHLERNDYRSMLDATRTMRTQGLPMTVRSLQFMRNFILPQREPGKRPILGLGPKFFDPLAFVATSYIHSAEHGQFVPDRLWVEVLKRYGMVHRWDEVERLVLRLLDLYAPIDIAKVRGAKLHTLKARRRLMLHRDMLRLVLGKRMLKAFVTWGFRGASSRDRLRPLPSTQSEVGNVSLCEQWARGLALLRTMAERNIPLDVKDIRQAFQQRMWILFGPGYSTLGLNNEARLPWDTTSAMQMKCGPGL